MAKKLSEHLAELSIRAKKTEDAVAAAQTEAHDKVVARREQARAAATAAVEKVNQDVKSVGDTAARNWSAVKAKVAAEADFAIDYAIASIEQAGFAAIDAIAGRVKAEQVKGAR